MTDSFQKISNKKLEQYHGTKKIWKKIKIYHTLGLVELQDCDWKFLQKLTQFEKIGSTVMKASKQKWRGVNLPSFYQFTWI